MFTVAELVDISWKNQCRCGRSARRGSMTAPDQGLSQDFKFI